MKLYSVYDKRAKEFGAPMVLHTDAHAVRAFQQEINRHENGNMLAQYPEDFSLHLIGNFDQDTGIVRPTLTKLLEGEAAKKPASNG